MNAWLQRWGPLWRPGLVWLLVLGPFFFASYGFANHRAAALDAVPSIVFEWERHIPLWPWTILPYWSIDFFYGLSLLICATRLELTRHALRLLTAQVICVAAFVLFPLKFSTPRPAVDGWAGAMFDALAGFDLPFNQAPSLHIVLLLILWDFYRLRLRGVWKGVLHGWSALIALSVLTTYQHHFIDIPTGVLAGALCLWLWPLQGERPRWRFTREPQRIKLASGYAIGAAMCAAAAVLLGREGWWLFWPAVSLTLVALCYAALGAEGFQKRPHGKHSLAVRWLTLPYRIGAWINARLWTWRQPAAVEVAPNVWLGRMPLPWDAEHRRFNTLIDVTAELAPAHRGARSHPWLDLTPPTPAQLRQAADDVEAARQRGPVLVCCALGYSRSSAVVATWLAAHRGLSVEEAVARVRQARPQVVLKLTSLAAIAEARA